MVRASLTGSASGIGRRDIDQMQQHPGALQMLQEADAEPGSFGGALDQPGNVRHDEAAAGTRGHHAQIRIQGREGIVGHFGPRRRDRADQGGFAGVRQPEQAHIRDQLEFEGELALLARQPQARLARGAVGARFEAGIAPAALAALGDQQGLALAPSDRPAARRCRGP